MPDPIVVNSSPIIVMARAGFLDLLRLIGEPVQVPEAVAQEIAKGDANDPATQALARTTWIVPVVSGTPPLRLQQFGLGPEKKRC